MKNNDLLVLGLQQLGIQITSVMLEQFDQYFELLIDWNTRMNLTAIVEEEDVIIKHFLDSILLVKAFNMREIQSVLDVGTGAGFPGIPLKIIFPHLKVVLLDSVNKKIQFLNEVCKQLGLNNMTCFHGRAEDLAKEAAYREKFNLVVSRAVSNLSTLSEYCLPFACLGGYFIAYKSIDCELEIEDSLNAISLLGGKIDKVESYKIPNSDIIRTYVLITKTSKTADYYPRKAGLPAKNPL